MKLSRIILLIFLSLIVVTGLIIFLVLNHSAKSLTDAEKEAALVNILGRKPILTNNEATGTVLYNGQYASFSYPAKAIVYTYKDPNIVKNKSELEMFSFDINNPRLIFNFSISDNSGNLADAKDSSGAIFRENQVNGYSQSEVVIGGAKGLVFAKAGEHPEKTGFWLTNNKLYALSVTGSDYQEVVNLFDGITTSLKFK
ncbi:MAG TPA: hypothetical protein VMR59_00110 [Patescibacteria group bacterium]|jgi:hypothetical protein|nr:hypothetical protein [Patescibacteria group bacterium]